MKIDKVDFIAPAGPTGSALAGGALRGAAVAGVAAVGAAGAARATLAAGAQAPAAATRRTGGGGGSASETAGASASSGARAGAGAGSGARASAGSDVGTGAGSGARTGAGAGTGAGSGASGNQSAGARAGTGAGIGAATARGGELEVAGARERKTADAQAAQAAQALIGARAGSGGAEAARLLAEYDLPVTAGLLEKVLAIARPLHGLSVEQAVFLVSDGIAEENLADLGSGAMAGGGQAAEAASGAAAGQQAGRGESAANGAGAGGTTAATGATGGESAGAGVGPAGAGKSLLPDILSGRFSLSGELSELGAALVNSGDGRLISNFASLMAYDAVDRLLGDILAGGADALGSGVAATTGGSSGFFELISANRADIANSALELLLGDARQAAGGAGGAYGSGAAERASGADGAGGANGVGGAYGSGAANGGAAGAAPPNGENPVGAQPGADSPAGALSGLSASFSAGLVAASPAMAQIALTPGGLGAPSELVGLGAPGALDASALDRLFFLIADELMSASDGDHSGAARAFGAALASGRIPPQGDPAAAARRFRELSAAGGLSGGSGALRLLNRLRLNPENMPELGQGAIKRQYGELLDRLGALKSAVAAAGPFPGKGELQARMETAESGLRIINDLNGQHAYAQIPLQINGKSANGELYVMKRGGRRKKISPDDATVFIALNTANMGRIEALIRMTRRKNVDVSLRAADQGALDTFRNSYARLHEALKQRGYKLSRATYRKLEDGRRTAPTAAMGEAIREFCLAPAPNIDCRV